MVIYRLYDNLPQLLVLKFTHLGSKPKRLISNVRRNPCIKHAETLFILIVFFCTHTKFLNQQNDNRKSIF